LAQSTVIAIAQVGHVPRVVEEYRAQLIGPFNKKQMLRLAFGLRPPRPAEEEQFLNDLQTRGNPKDGLLPIAGEICGLEAILFT